MGFVDGLVSNAVSPARAWMDLHQGEMEDSWNRFPRTRGDGPDPLGLMNLAQWFPPHARGWTITEDITENETLVSPARAGMDPLLDVKLRLLRRFPRTRGDGPSYYATEKPLPAKLDECFAISRTRTDEDEKAVEKVLNRFFTVDVEGYRNKRADKEIGEYHESSDKKKVAGRAGAAARWGGKRNADANADAYADANADSMASHSHSHSQNQSQIPEPDPQPKPERSEKKDLFSTSQKSEPVNGSPGTEEPVGPNEGWNIILEWRAYGKSAGKTPPRAIMESFPEALWDAGDMTGARMAFKEAYAKNVLKYPE